MARAKNPAAVELGRLGGKKKVPKGFAKMPKARLSEIARKAAKSRWANPKKKERLLSEVVSAGGRARAAKLSPERRREIARKAAAARWGKRKKAG